MGCNCGGKKSGVKYEVRKITDNTVIATEASLAAAQAAGETAVGRGHYTTKAVPA